jgi:peptidyl-prolyl cis-trans isomerase D
MRPPRFKLAWVELSPERYRERIEVTDEDIRREYEARKQAGTLAGRAQQGRDARHILLKTGDERSEEEALARAMELRQRITDGTPFADVARRNSEDAATADRGGSLGVVRKGDLPESMHEALFSLDPGQISEPVVTDAGVHLVQRGEADTDAETPSLADKRDEIARELRQGRIRSQLTEDASRLDQLAFEHTDLQTPAEKLDLDIRTTDWFSLENPAGIASNAAVREAMQTPEVREDGQNSELLEVGERRLVIRLADRKPAEPRPLDEVAGRIREQIKSQRARKALEQQAETVRKQLEDGADLDRIASVLERSVQSADGVRRNARQPSGKLVNQAFSMPRPGDGVSGPALVRLADGGLGVVAVTGVTDGEPSQMSDQERSQALSGLERTQGRQTLRTLIAWLRAEGKVDIKEKVLEEGEGGASGSGGAAGGGSPR